MTIMLKYYYINIIISSEFCYVPKVVLLVSYWKRIQNRPAKQNRNNDNEQYMVRKIWFWGFEIEKETMVLVANEIAESLGSTMNMAWMSRNLW